MQEGSSTRERAVRCSRCGCCAATNRCHHPRRFGCCETGALAGLLEAFVSARNDVCGPSGVADDHGERSGPRLVRNSRETPPRQWVGPGSFRRARARAQRSTPPIRVSAEWTRWVRDHPRTRRVGEDDAAEPCSAALEDPRVIRANGVESEADLEFGVVDQLLRQADAGRVELPGGDHLRAGTLLLQAIDAVEASAPIVIAIDDCHWVDQFVVTGCPVRGPTVGVRARPVRPHAAS